MSLSSPSPSDSAKTKLETVVNQPLMIVGGGFGLLLLAVPAMLACIAARKGDAVKDNDAPRAALPAIIPPANLVAVTPIARTIAEDASPTTAGSAPTCDEPRRRIQPVVVRMIPPPARTPRPLDPVLQFPDVKTPPAPKRLDRLSEDLLRENLAKYAKEVDLETVKGTREKLLAKARERSRAKSDKKIHSPILALCAERGDLKGLPLIGEDACQAKAEAVKKMQVISRELRLRLRGGPPRSYPYGPSDLSHVLPKQDDWFQNDGLSTVAQMVQAEESPMRRAFVKRLTTVKSSNATALLARQAVFDISREVREQAIEALKNRPEKDSRQVLLDGLRYPWSPAAAHAAEALVALDDQEAIPRLASLLDEPDPCAPRCENNKKWVVREVVRLNHLRNCLLCHASSTEAKDPLRGIVPTPGKPLPNFYYSSQKGDFVRADVTYLRQDFSLMERVAKPNHWPRGQRFDYLVRTRELTADERTALVKKAPQKEPASYPQREAVLFALRELTGWDVGKESASWHELIRWLDDPS